MHKTTSIHKFCAQKLWASSAVVALMTGAAMTGAAPAFAQDAPPPAAKVVPPPAAKVAAQPVEQTSSSDIIVTAQRKSESQQNVPIAITAFSQEALAQKSIYNSFELNKAVPGLNTVSDQASSSLPQFSIRGRGQSYGAASGSVETYFADVPLSPPFESPTLPPQFFDLQSVQVLKGPQGTLFGRNSTGGAVLFVPAPPTDKPGGYVRVQGGNYGDVQVEGAVNIPISDIASLRVAGFLWRRNGYSRTIAGSTDFFGATLPSQTINNQDVTEVRATLLLKPTERLTNSTIVTYHTDNNRGSLQAQFYARPAGPIPAASVEPGINARSFYNNVNLEHQPSSTWAVINTTSYELNDALTLKNIFGHIQASSIGANPSDYDGSGYNPTANPFNISNLETGLAAPRLNHNYQTTEEVQLQGHAFDNKLEYIVGGLLDLTRQPGSPDKINFFNLTYSYGTFPNVINESFTQNNFSSKSLFGSATFHITDSLSISGGARHIWDHISQLSVNSLVTTVTSAVPASAVYTKNVKDFAGWTYNASLEYHPTSKTMFYGGYRRGYKRGGFNAQAGVPSQLGFAAETDDDFYIGVKQNLNVFGVPGHFNLEGFNDIYHNAQRYYLGVVNGSLVSVVVNAEKSTYRGFDMDFTVDPAKWLSLSASYGFVDSKYNKFTDQSVPAAALPSLGNPSSDLSVNPVGLVSRNKVSGTVRLHTPLSDGSEIAFAPSLNYQSKLFADDYSKRLPIANALLGTAFSGVGQVNLQSLGLDTVPGYSTVDLRAEWNKVGGSNFDLAANVNNLTNKTYLLAVNGLYGFGVQAAIYGPPRLLTFDVRYHF